jgi:ribonucleoside-diphosphate reductase alpha chain
LHIPSKHATEILEKRYYQGDEKTWEDLSRRVANAVGWNNHTAEADFFWVLSEGLFIPNTPCLVNAGKPEGQLMACFVLPVDDSIDGIFEAVKKTAHVHKSGGGTGFDFSKLRPEGSAVKGTGGISSGPVSFMKVFDEATQQMKQGGVRRGANMGVLRVDHPDIVKFIKCKDDQTELTNFNISVAITAEFMAQLEEGDSIWLCNFGSQSYAIDQATDQPLELFPGHKGKQCYTAKDIWDLICQQAHKNGEPGIIFIDRIKQINGKAVDAVNPCGEQPLEPYEACVLGSIDLSKFVAEQKIDWDKLKKVTQVGVQFLDNVVSVSKFPFTEIRAKVKTNRKIGLGVMGFADMLLKLGEKYGSKPSIRLAERVMQFIQDVAREASAGRNATLTTIAPTGSVSILAGCSSGIEPNHSWVTKHEREGFDDVVTTHYLADPFISSQQDLPDHFVTADDIPWEEHVRMQAAFQKHVDNGVSKTINLPKDASVEDVSGAYKLAYELGCKGIKN